MSRTLPKRAFFRPFLELLETRDAPSVTPWAVENFDSTTVGQIPSNWSQWASDGSQAWMVENTAYQTSPNGIQSNQGSSVTSRAWLNNTVLSDVDVTASFDVT